MSVTTTDVSATLASTTDHSADAETVVLAWRVHRLRDERWRALPLVLTAYGVALLLWRLVFPTPLALFLPLVALTGALSEYLFPISYRLTDRGVYADCGASRLFLEWADVRRATVGSDGVYVSPLARASRLDSFRGIKLRFHDGNDAVVLETVRSLWRGGESPDRSVV